MARMLKFCRGGAHGRRSLLLDTAHQVVFGLRFTRAPRSIPGLHLHLVAVRKALVWGAKQRGEADGEHTIVGFQDGGGERRSTVQPSNPTTMGASSTSPARPHVHPMGRACR